ncbi:outer membrane beta-barrel protein [Algiphilus sp.]|uniref:outer membrane beta-barrel protein n=1 Tax=Algiphilus sp. TaxID=1872431 RepID=UPI0025C09DF4|nr:outer membrane beta-barrel protein [Algiphilus sp.]MCK5770987.1 porin family protein [Algiphilus sp.]
MKKLMTLAPGIVLAGSFASFPAAAQMSDDLAFDPSIYAGGSAGYFRLNDDDFLDEEDEFKDNRWAWRGLAGVQLNPVFSIEGGYIDFGELNDGDFTLNADGTFAAALVHLPLANGFSPYAKLGQLWWDAELEGPSGFFGNRATASDDGSDTFYGFGVRFGEGPGMQLRLEYDRLALDDTDVDMGSVTLQYNF